MSAIVDRAVTLDDRLRAIADFVPDGALFADIGCDHGYLDAWLLARGRVREAELTDISEPSLRKAERLLHELALEDRARFSVGDGALALTRTPDCCVIAGMGGHMIIDILEKGRERLAQARLILQCNVCQEDLRAYLSAHGRRITGERVAKAAGRHYIILCADPGEERLSDIQLFCGPRLLENGDPLFASYARFRIRVAAKALAGAEQTDPVRAAELRREIRIWEEGLTCCRPLETYTERSIASLRSVPRKNGTM